MLQNYCYPSSHSSNNPNDFETFLGFFNGNLFFLMVLGIDFFSPTNFPPFLSISKAS